MIGVFDDMSEQHEWCRIHWKGRLAEVDHLIRELQGKKRRILETIKEHTPREEEKS